MTNMRKVISVALIMILLLLAALSFGTVHANAGIIYESSATDIVTSGVTLEKITRFTDEGWLYIKVMRVDLSNNHISLDAITNSNSIKTLATVRSLAQSRGAVAAVNGSFFNWMSEAGSGYPDGPIVESGKLITATSEYNRYGDHMASFSLDNQNQIFYDYWKTDMSLSAPNGNSVPVGQYNKPSRDYNDFTVLDKRWGEYSIGASQTYPDIVEMVVDKGKVMEIRFSQPAAQIPSGGYVVVTRQAGGAFINANFKIGAPVQFNINTYPDWNRFKMSVTGSAILVSEGKIPQPFSFDIPGRKPRTAVGSTKDGKQLLFVTVDGGKSGSIGMTQLELARFMLELGAYNALNLDGGGSTTMAARKLGTGALELVNIPSDGAERKVAAAVGIFTGAPPSPLYGMVIDTVDTNVFVNTSRKFSVRGYDKYYNPVQIEPSSVKWSVSGIQGSFAGNVFYPKSVGDGKIKASVGNVTAELKISVLSAPVKLQLGEKQINLGVNQKKILEVSGKNVNGYRAKISPNDIKWAVSGPIGFFDNGTFIATAGGTGYIEASVGSVRAYCAVSVSENGRQPSVDIGRLPKDTEPADEANRSVNYQKTPDSFRFAVMGQSGEPANLLEKILYLRLSEKINSYLDVSAFVGNTTGSVTELVKTPLLATSSGYKAMDFKNSRFIQLDTAKQGIRASAQGQWNWFRQQLETAKGGNIFIFVSIPPQNFSDKQEAALFQDVLITFRQKTGKNVWVFFKGESNASFMERGIKYISIAGLDAGGLSPSNTSPAEYLLVTVGGSGPTFEFKPIISQ